MVLADLGRRIRTAISSLSQATVINEDVRLIHVFIHFIPGSQCDAERGVRGAVRSRC